MPMCSECKIIFIGRKSTALTCSDGCGLLRTKRLKAEDRRLRYENRPVTVSINDKRHPDSILENQTGLISERMREMGLTHETLAVRSEYSVRRVATICRGGPISLNFACRVAPILNLSVEEIMSSRTPRPFCKDTAKKLLKDGQQKLSALERKVASILWRNPNVTFGQLLRELPDDYPHKIKDALRRLNGG